MAPSSKTTKSSKQAPPPPPPPEAVAPAPLADYFFIAGIESSQVYDERLAVSSPISPLGDAIAEDDDYLSNQDGRPTTPGSPIDAKQRARFSFEARKSIGSLVTIGESQAPGSNRSSVTIKAGPRVGGSGMDDDAFEDALKKFTSERDSFLEDIHISAGTVPTPTQRKPRPKTIRITQEELSSASPGFRGSVGSLQRRLSTMKSMKRAPSVMSRQSSVKTSKRVSNYNSVIPAPQPFTTSPDMHPLKRQYEPVLLDRYPPKTGMDEAKRRAPFPDYVPMFTFPNDVTVVSSDERPRSSWHGFAMTNQDNSKLYGVCVIIWLPLNQEASDALERQCEEWRRLNMKPVDRELASSLGERLSNERAKLSRLLADLPTMPSGSPERERLEDQISEVEEKIGLMTDMLRPVRHGAASKIDGLTEGDTGFWIPRAYGILGRDASLTSFWKEWLKAVTVPMLNGAVLRVPPSSPRVGLWQPLERYVVNLCVEAMSPITSITQVEVAVRELRLYARTEAINELPGSRNTDIYALFRCLTIPNIITLFEYALAESRIILLSSHTSMLQLATAALTSLLFPLKWAGVLIPVLPARLLQALEAPCPYIIGVERRYENLDLPDDDFCIVDLDDNSIESTAPPVNLPRPQRRKLQSLLQAAAPHHNRFGVPVGPPQYAIETFPHGAFASENPQVFSSRAEPSTLSSYVSESSTTFGTDSTPCNKTIVFNGFLQSSASARGSDRPSTSSTSVGGHSNNSSSSGHTPPSPTTQSPVTGSFPALPVSRNDSGFALQATLREKRSGHFAEGLARRNSAVTSLFNARNPLQDRTNTAPQYGYDRPGPPRRPSAALSSHHPSPSTSTLGYGGPSDYAPSVYAQSTLAASTILPQMMMQVVRDDETTKWIEGHCLHRQPRATKPSSSTTITPCSVCDERCGSEDETFRCTGCGIVAHPRCLGTISLPCPIAFRADQVRAAFVRCFASLFYTYRRYLHPASGENRKAGLVYHFNMDQFLRSVPHGDGAYMDMLRGTQSFNEFIHEREAKRPEQDPHIRLFDEIILSKRNRGRPSFFSKSETNFLADTADHLWRSASAPPPNNSRLGTPGATTSGTSVSAAGGGPTAGSASSVGADSRPLSAGRAPAMLDPALMKEPRSIQGAPRLPPTRTKRKPVASMLGLSSQSADS